jgi:isocitrate dehydrogenase (NAD+)
VEPADRDPGGEAREVRTRHARSGLGGQLAALHGRKRVTLVHKANILKLSHGLFLDVGKLLAAD